MKKIITLLIISISLIGCSGNGVSSPDYTEPNRNEPTYNTPTYTEPEEQTDSNIVIDDGQPDCAIYEDWMPCSKIDTVIYY